MIILGKRYNLCSVDTFEYLIEKDANIHADNDYALRYSAKNGHLDVVKFLVEKKELMFMLRMIVHLGGVQEMGIWILLNI